MAYGEFTCNFNLVNGFLNIMAQKNGTGFIYIINYNNKKKKLDREQTLNFLTKIYTDTLAWCKKRQKPLGKVKALIDVDSTLVQFHQACKKRLAEFGLDFHWECLTDYYGKGNIGVPWEDVRKAMRDPVTYEPEYLQDYKGVTEGISLLSKYADINGYTGAENISAIYEKRFDFCRRHRMNPNVFLGSKPVLEGFNILFDDNPYIIDKWLNSPVSNNMTIYMIRQPYNMNIRLDRKWSKVRRVNSFYDGVKDYVSRIS